MAVSPGRTTQARTITVSKTTGSTAVTGAAGTFTASDAGRGISGTGIAASTTIASVASSTAATLSANATATSSNAAVVAALPEQGNALGFVGWSPETDAEAASYTVAANNAGTATPDRILDTKTDATTWSRRIR